VKVGGESIANFGDMSMFSFHATKLYHSIEGGLLTFQDGGIKQTLDYLKNFGFASETEVVMPGTNAKMNEFQALMGALVLKHINELIQAGKAVDRRYREGLAGIPGIHLTPSLPDNVVYNYAYFPIEVDEGEYGMSRDQLYQHLHEHNVFVRRYFYPLLTEFACYKNIHTNDPLTVAKGVAERILCLPTYFDLELDSVDKICEIIKIIKSN